MFVALVAAFQLNDDQTITEQHADQCVLASEEHVGVAEHAVLEDQKHAQHEKRRVLQHD